MFEARYTIKAQELDSAYKHLHHARALLFLEKARLDWLIKIGFPNENFIARNLFFVITGMKLSYQRELFAEDIVVTCFNPKIDGKLVSLEQSIINQRGKIAVQASVESKFVSGETKRSVEAPADFAQAFLSS